MSVRAFAKLQKLPLKYVDSHAYGDHQSDHHRCGAVFGWTPHGIYSVLYRWVTILGTLVFMLLINVKIALVVILITPVSLFVASFIAKRTYVFFKAQSETRAQMTSLSMKWWEIRRLCRHLDTVTGQWRGLI